MNCKYHPHIQSSNTCNMCGDWLCDNCTLEVSDRNYCKDCLKNTLENKQTPSSIIEPKQDQIISKQDQINKYYSILPKDNNLLGDLIAYGIGLIPGCGQMFLGNSLKGVILLSTIVLMIFSGLEFFMPLFMALYFYSFFDTVVFRRKLKKTLLYKKYDLNPENFPPLNISEKPNLLLTLMFGAIPGCAQMYLGYTYYGTIISTLFLYTMLININLGGALTLIIYLFSFFNAINLRRQILNGIYFDDNPKQIAKIFKTAFKNSNKLEMCIDKKIIDKRKKNERDN